MNRHVGKIALITGAGQGVGRAIALRLASEGASVAVNDVRPAPADAVAAEVTALGGTALALPFDVTDYEQVGTSIAEAVAHFGGLDIVVNNAGNIGTGARGWTMRDFWETEPDEWQPFIDVNLFGVMNCCRHALPTMIEQGRGGRVITIVSDSARTGEPKLEAYAAAKAGAAGFTRSLAKSVARHGITANSIALGTMWGEHYAGMEPAELARRMQPYLVRRPGQPDEVAALVAHLAADEAAWTTGQTIPLNGGYSTS